MLSTNDALLLRFKTDSTIINKGFSASYVAVEAMSPPSAEYSSQIDEDDIDLAFRKNKNGKQKKFMSSIKLKVGVNGNDDDDNDEDDDDDNDDDDQEMLAAKTQ